MAEAAEGQADRLHRARDVVGPDSAQVCDAEGRPIRTEEREVAFEIEGNCRTLGVDNGSNTSVQDYKSDRCTTAQGRCLLVVQSTEEAGTVRITASAEGLESQSVELHIC